MGEYPGIEVVPKYFGDTRIQALIALYNTRDRYMARNAIEQGTFPEGWILWRPDG